MFLFFMIPVCLLLCKMCIHTKLWPLTMRPNSPEMLSMKLEGGEGKGDLGNGFPPPASSPFAALSPSWPSLNPFPTKHASAHPSIPSLFPPSLVRDSSIILSLALLEEKTSSTSAGLDCCKWTNLQQLSFVRLCYQLTFGK